MDRKVSMLATNMIRLLHRQEKLSRLASEFYPNSCEENNSSVLQLLIVKGTPMSRNYTSDQELIDRLLLNDTDAFEELYRRYWYSLYTYSLKKLQSSDAARQIVKNIFIELWEKRQSWPASFSVSSHLYTEVRKSVVKCLNEKLINDSYNEMIEQQIASGFSANALQSARMPVVKKSPGHTPSELIRQNTIDRKDAKYNIANLANMKWLYHLISAKLD